MFDRHHTLCQCTTCRETTAPRSVRRRPTIGDRTVDGVISDLWDAAAELKRQAEDMMDGYFITGHRKSKYALSNVASLVAELDEMKPLPLRKPKHRKP
jgi:hypothetical protein